MIVPEANLLPPPLPPPLPTHPPTTPRSGNYLIRHWRGELALGQVFWISLICLWFPWASATFGLFYALFVLRPLGQSALAGLNLVSVALTFAFVIWQLVGAARAIRRQWPRTEARRTSWFALAGLLAYLAVLVVYVQIRTCPAVLENVEILQGDQSIPALNLSLRAAGRVMSLNGGLRAGSAQRVRDFLAKAPAVEVLYLESPGGRLLEAEDIASMVADRGLTTCVTGHCASAATLVFLAGRERFVGANGRIGFHSSSSPAWHDEVYSNHRLLNDMLARGVDKQFTLKALAVPSCSLWHPTVDELYLAGVITRRIVPDDLPQ